MTDELIFFYWMGWFAALIAFLLCLLIDRLFIDNTIEIITTPDGSHIQCLHEPISNTRMWVELISGLIFPPLMIVILIYRIYAAVQIHKNPHYRENDIVIAKIN